MNRRDEDLPASPPAADAVAMIIAAALDEDRASFDVTTRATVPADQPGEATVLFKQAGVICGLDVLAQVFQQVSDEIEVSSSYVDGEWVEDGTEVAEVTGPLAAILSGERVALNLIQRMSGIATMAHEYVEAARSGGDTARVVDTRKTTPGLRAIERYAVRVGGAHNHRNTLEDGVLIKDNHIEAGALRGLDLAGVIALARERTAHTLRIEVEVTDAAMARAAVGAGADIVLLDNMTPVEMRAVVAEHRAGPRPFVLFEASGGITLATIAEVASTGVDLISCGALTHSAPALDVSLDVRAV